MSNLELHSYESLQIRSNDFDTFNNGQGKFSGTLEVLGSEKFEAPDLKFGEDITFKIEYKYYNNKGKEIKKPTEEEKQTLKRRIQVYTKDKSGKEVNISSKDLKKYISKYGGIQLRNGIFRTGYGGHLIKGIDNNNESDFLSFCNQKEEVTDTDLHIFNNVTQISINDDEADSNPLTEAERIRLKNLLKNSEGAYSSFKRRHGRTALNKDYHQYTDKKGNIHGKPWEVLPKYAHWYKSEWIQDATTNYLTTSSQGNNGEMAMLTQDTVNHEMGHSRDPYLIDGIDGYEYPKIYPQKFREIASKRTIPLNFIAHHPKDQEYLLSLPELRADKEALKALLYQKRLRNGKKRFTAKEIDDIKGNENLYEFDDKIGFINRRAIRILQTFPNSQDIADLLNFHQNQRGYEQHLATVPEQVLQKDLDDLDQERSYLLFCLENIKNTVFEEPYSPIKIYKVAHSYCTTISGFELTLPSLSLLNTSTSEWIKDNLGLDIEYYGDEDYICEGTITEDKKAQFFKTLEQDKQEILTIFEQKKQKYKEEFYDTFQVTNTEAQDGDIEHTHEGPIFDGAGNLNFENILTKDFEPYQEYYNYLKNINNIATVIRTYRSYLSEKTDTDNYERSLQYGKNLLTLLKIPEDHTIYSDVEDYGIDAIIDNCKDISSLVYDKIVQEGSINEEYLKFQIDTGIWDTNNKLYLFFRDLLIEKQELEDKITQNNINADELKRYNIVKKQLRYTKKWENSDLSFFNTRDKNYEGLQEQRYVLLKKLEDSDFTTEEFKNQEIAGTKRTDFIFRGVERFWFDTLETTFQSLETDLEAYKKLGLRVPKEPMSFGDQFLWILDHQTNGYFTVQLNRLNTKLWEFYQNDNTKGTMDYSTRLSNLANTQHQIQDQ